MARRQQNELVAGAFVITALTVLVGVIIWMGGSGIFKPVKQQAFFFRNEADGGTGLLGGSAVTIGDDQIGKIASIRFDARTGRTYYLAEIERGDFKIHSDGQARAKSGLVGGSLLTIISRGSEQSPLADQDHPMEIAGGLDQAMADLSSAAQELSKTVKAELSTDNPEALLRKVHDIIDSLGKAAVDVASVAANVLAQTNIDDKQAVLAKINRSVEDINAMTADARPKVSEALENVRAVSGGIRGYVDKDVADILAKLRESNNEVLKITKDLSAVSGNIREMVLVHKDNIDELLDNMVAVSANLKAASKEVRRNPWRLLYKPDNQELHSTNIRDAAMAFSNGAEQLDQAISKLTNLAKASPQGVPADDPTLLKVRQHLQETFDNFSKAEDALWKEIKK